MAVVLPINSITPLQAQLASGQDMCQSIMLLYCALGKTDDFAYTLCVSGRPKVKWCPRNRVLQRINICKWLPPCFRKSIEIGERRRRGERSLIPTGQRKE